MTILIERSGNTIWVKTPTTSTAIDGTDYLNATLWRRAVLDEVSGFIGLPELTND